MTPFVIAYPADGELRGEAVRQILTRVNQLTQEPPLDIELLVWLLRKPSVLLSLVDASSQDTACDCCRMGVVLSERQKADAEYRERPVYCPWCAMARCMRG